MAKTDLTASRLRELLDYNPLTGLFTWRVGTNNRAKAGALAGSIDRKGYRNIQIDRRQYCAHRLAWLHFHGMWPEWEIDHINGVCHDNRLENLRDVSRSVNQQNRRKAQAKTKTGVFGVCVAGKKYSAGLRVNGKYQKLGRFDTVEEASAAYLSAKRSLHIGCTI